MNKEEETSAEKVEKLKHFPFKNFQELKKSQLEGVAQIGIDRSVSLQWIQGGIHCPRHLTYYAIFLASLPLIVGVCFILYSLISKTWLLLLALPLLLVSNFLFHPGFKVMLGLISKILIFLSFVGLFYSIITNKEWLLAISLSLVIIWWAQKTIYQKATNTLTKTLLEHEDLLCMFWNSKALSINLFNNNKYWADWKVEDGEHIHYN